MARLQIYNQIVDEQTKIMLRDWWGEESVCYKDIAEFLNNIDEKDNSIDIKIHCPGGDCMEGWAIYDALRNSGKEVSTFIEGECSSMATIILLAAPKERRFAFQHAQMMIHDPSVAWLDVWTSERLTAEEIEKARAKLSAQKACLLAEREKIISLYEERTGCDRKTLTDLMAEEKFVDMDRAIELGFISSTIEPNTASRINHPITKAMAKQKITIENRLVKRLLSMAGLAKIEDVKILDQQITAADGTEFTVEREDGDPQVGDTAYPNGTYVLEDGTTIVVEDEVIASITPASNGEGEVTEPESEPDGGTTDLQQQVDDLTAQVASLTEQVNSLTASNNDLTAKNETLAAEAKSDEEKSILEIVAKAGGKPWLDGLKGMKSVFNAANRQFVAHGDDNQNQTQAESVTQRLIREQRERQESKRQARKGK